MDTYLIEGIQENNEAIFTQVFKQYNAKLFYYFLRKTQSESVSADLVQITFIKCWRYRENLRCDLALSHQLFRIAKTSLIDLLRQKAKERLVSLDVCPSLTERPDTPGDFHPWQEEVSGTLNKLSPERSKIIKFRLEGFTNKEIAEQLGISKKTVENQLNKAVKEIRNQLATTTTVAFPFFLLGLLYSEAFPFLRS